MKFFLVAISTLTVACASAAPESSAPAAPVQTQTTSAGLGMYEGTYALQAPSRVIELRVYVDHEGNLNGELVGMGQQTTFRASDTPHRFLHGNADDIWVQFTIENGRATGATMHQRGREISGQRSK
jgi:hypothetical protein